VLPPLRVRGNDVLLLAQHFVVRAAERYRKGCVGVTRPVAEALLGYRWPGNVRELQNVIERAVVLARGPIVQIDASMVRMADATESSSIDTLENVERRHILRALNETGWVIHGRKGAAEILGINSSTLRSRMAKLGIKKTQAVR